MWTSFMALICAASRKFANSTCLCVILVGYMRECDYFTIVKISAKCELLFRLLYSRKFYYGNVRGFEYKSFPVILRMNFQFGRQRFRLPQSNFNWMNKIWAIDLCEKKERNEQPITKQLKQRADNESKRKKILSKEIKLDSLRETTTISTFI